MLTVTINLPGSDTVLGTKKGKYTDERNFT